VKRFAEIVFEAGISAPVRTPRGRDIDAACGQLKTAAERRSRAEPIAWRPRSRLRWVDPQRKASPQPPL
jgi:hypothetical protein